VAHRNKSKGDRFERAVVAALRALGFPHADRTRAGYERDRGDVEGTLGLVFQAKDHADKRWGPWLDDLDEQKTNARADHAVLVVKRTGIADASEALAVMRLRDWTRLARDAGYGDPLDLQTQEQTNQEGGSDE
jgi:hypothetical protein